MRLGKHFGFERWLMVGGSWGCALALAYAEEFPTRVSGLRLSGVTTGRREEFDWLFRGGAAQFFPGEWRRLKEGLPVEARGGDIVEAYCRLLEHPQATAREQAALAWCQGESATPDWPPEPGLAPRFRDPQFAMAFARIVTHYVRHDGWLGDGRILRDAARLADNRGVLISGRFDFQAPIANAWTLHRCWPGAQLRIVAEAGHSADAPGITGELIRAIASFVAEERS